MKDIYIIDASGYLYRSYFAIRGMTNAKGESTNALFGFIRSIQKLIKDFDPKYLVSVFDGPQCGKHRKEIYPAYKAHRAEMPGDLRYQIGWAQKYCDLVGIPKLVVPDVEADDTMGSIAKWWVNYADHVYLCTSDKDMAQLVNGKVKILNTHKENLILGSKEVEETYGVPPEHIIDYLAIMGDASDNVPGVPGFGPKKAAALVKDFGTVENIISNVDKLKSKRDQEILSQNIENAELSKKLVTIDTEIEFPHDVEFFFVKSPDIAPLKEFYSEMKFNSLLKELDSLPRQEASKQQESADYVLVDDEKSFEALLDMLSKQKEICLDTETTGVRPLESELVGIGFGMEPGKSWYVPLNGQLGKDRVLQGIKPLIENKKIGFYGHNIKYDKHILANHHIEIGHISFDTILASFILNSHSRQHSLDALALENFGKVKIPITDLIGKGKNEISMSQVPLEKITEYCCEDVDYTVRLKKKFEKELKERGLEKLFYDIELPLLSILAKMERHGIFIDLSELKSLNVEITKLIEQYANEIYYLAGETFNLNSPKQLSVILFDKLKITPPNRSKIKTGISTNAEVLEELSVDNPIAEKLLDYRTVEKLRSTYVETLPSMVSPTTHRIHPSFNQTGAATGRLSCNDPNLQNIPLHSEIGSQIRMAFQPEKKNWSFLGADYSQIELRLLAHMSQDPTLISAFKNNEDIHTHTAAAIFGIPLSEVTKELRFHAKAVNFGLIYGQGAFGLSRQLKISVGEAAAFIEKYFNRYTHVKEFLESCKEKARQTGKAVTLTGRERAIPEITSKNAQIRAAAERLAVNTPFQGTAADMIKMAMIEIDKSITINKKIGYMILQIHDELIFEVPDFELLDMETLVRSKMEGVMKLKVPLIVDVAIGKNWKEC